jgi:hypothetical protein
LCLPLVGEMALVVRQQAGRDVASQLEAVEPLVHLSSGSGVLLCNWAVDVSGIAGVYGLGAVLAGGSLPTPCCARPPRGNSNEFVDSRTYIDSRPS